MTFYQVTHTIQAVLLPPGIIFFSVFIGLLLWKRYPFFSKTLILFSFFSLWLLSIPKFSMHLISGLQSQYPPLQIDNLTNKKLTGAIIILGGGAKIAPEYTNKHFVSDTTLSRLHYAVFLENKIHLPLIVSGGNASIPIYTEADLMFTVLKDDFKVPVLWKENKSTNTVEESKFILPFLKQHKINTIYLVTNAWHMPRSVFVFKQSGLTIIPAPMGYISLPLQKSVLDYIPTLDALNISTMAIHEYMGLLWYRIRIL